MAFDGVALTLAKESVSFIGANSKQSGAPRGVRKMESRLTHGCCAA